jgi:hypothetical protein
MTLVTATAVSGDAVAAFAVNGLEAQAVAIVRPDGHIEGSCPVWRLIVPTSAVGANQVHLDLFNATGSGVTLRVLSAFAYARNDVAITGTLGVEVALTRTSAVGTGGTTVAADATALTTGSLTRFDPAAANLDANITARVRPTGGATAGALIGTRFVFTEETNAATALAGIQGAEFVRNEGAKVLVPQGTGLRFVQGAIASVGTLAFEITFELI